MSNTGAGRPGIITLSPVEHDPRPPVIKSVLDGQPKGAPVIVSHELTNALLIASLLTVSPVPRPLSRPCPIWRHAIVWTCLGGDRRIYLNKA